MTLRNFVYAKIQHYIRWEKNQEKMSWIRIRLLLKNVRDILNIVLQEIISSIKTNLLKFEFHPRWMK
jgi:hypothetical protein